MLEVRSGHIPQPWLVTQHRLVTSLVVRGTARAGASMDRWAAGTQVHVQFGAYFLEAVEAGLFGGVDLAVLTRLGSPLARHVYVALAQARVLPGGTLAATYRSPLLGWAELLGLRVGAAQVLRTLSPVHAILQRAGAVTGVTPRRAGASPIIEYHFPVGATAGPGRVSAHWASPGPLGGGPLDGHGPGPGEPTLTTDVGFRHPVFTRPPSGLPGPHRTVHDALALLGWRLTRSVAGHRVRDQAVQAYLDGHLSEADLIDLSRCSSAAQARRWLSRRLRRTS